MIVSFSTYHFLSFYRFTLNLQCGTDEGADIMYHFNPRFGDNVLVCNNRCADSWGDEERLEGLPIGPGDNFTLCIVAAKDGYQPILNGSPLPLFPHRLDMAAACSIIIDGDVKVKDLTVDCPPVRNSVINMTHEYAVVPNRAMSPSINVMSCSKRKPQ